MDRNKPRKVNRSVVFERMAVNRCTSKEARQALKSYFKKRYQVAQTGGIKAHVTKQKQRAEELEYTQSISSGS